MSILSFSPFGYEGSLINVEVDLRRGIPALDIVGLSDGAVKESRERMKNAIRNSGFEFPPERVLISLSPADIKKEGSGFDLPIALAVLEAQLPQGENAKDALFCMGELELSGSVRNVKGVNAGLQTALLKGIAFAIIPHTDNLVIPKGMKVATVGTLAESYNVMCKFAHGDYSDFRESDSEENTEFKVEFDDVNEEENIDKIKGHNGLKFAMAVAVAGKHNILAIGSAGCGKTMLLMRMPQLMPKLTADEKASVARIYSIAGMSGCIKDNARPFRMPHQTASIEGICGGGSTCRPGEISLAHNGVLFLDEAAEFRSSVLQMLRVPLEIKTITLSRAGRSTVYPANFQLVMATNPCPCGNYGVKDRICLCSAKSVEQYWKKFSAPLLDRFAIRFNVNEDYDSKELTDSVSVLKDWSLKELRSMIENAWIVQSKRGVFNNELNADEIPLTSEANKIIREWETEWSPRKLTNTLRLARTLQDMRGIDGVASTEVDDIAVNSAIKLIGSTPLEFNFF